VHWIVPVIAKNRKKRRALAEGMVTVGCRRFNIYVAG
jgi:hypothetical protein